MRSDLNLNLNLNININTLFYELIRVAIGTQDCLSRVPSEGEWEDLFDMAMKQSLVGVCFSGLQHLGADADEGYSRIGMSEDLYLTWMGMATQISMRNETVNEQCADLQKRLLENGFRSSILKGQGMAALYSSVSSELSLLRQSGDIDVYVDCGMETALKYCRETFGNVKWDYINAHVPFYKDTEVELHWRIHSLPNLFFNRRLQKWFSERVDDVFGGSVNLYGGHSLVVPTNEFNLFFILLHAYHHMFESGLGLRQLMDYYFVLRQGCSEVIKQHTNQAVAEFGLAKFESAVMWILQWVLGLREQYLLCPANETEGRFILNEIMQNGNFGNYDERKVKITNKFVRPFVIRIQHNWHLVTHYPSEFLWSPVWLIWHFVWKRTMAR